MLGRWVLAGAEVWRFGGGSAYNHVIMAGIGDDLSL